VGSRRQQQWSKGHWQLWGIWWRRGVLFHGREELDLRLGPATRCARGDQNRGTTVTRLASYHVTHAQVQTSKFFRLITLFLRSPCPDYHSGEARRWRYHNHKKLKIHGIVTVFNREFFPRAESHLSRVRFFIKDHPI
jgi:hypothetical protein